MTTDNKTPKEQTSTNNAVNVGVNVQFVENRLYQPDLAYTQDEICNKTSPHDSMLSMSKLTGEVLSMGSKTSKPKKTEVCCTNRFKNPANIGSSLNKLWAEIINVIENAGNAGYNEDMQGHAYPNSNEFEVSDK